MRPLTNVRVQYKVRYALTALPPFSSRPDLDQPCVSSLIPGSPTQSLDWNPNHPARPTTRYDQTFPRKSHVSLRLTPDLTQIAFSSFPPSPISPFNGYTPYDPSYTTAHSHETHYASSSMSMNPGLVRWPSTGSTLTPLNNPYPAVPQNGPIPTAPNQFALPSFNSFPDLPATFLPYQDASYQPWEFNFGSDTDSDCEREEEVVPTPDSSAQPDMPIIASAGTTTLGLLPSAIIVDVRIFPTSYPRNLHED